MIIIWEVSVTGQGMEMVLSLILSKIKYSMGYGKTGSSLSKKMIAQQLKNDIF